MRLIYGLLLTLSLNAGSLIDPQCLIGQLIPSGYIVNPFFSENNTFHTGELVAYTASDGRCWFAGIIDQGDRVFYHIRLGVPGLTRLCHVSRLGKFQ